MARPTVKSPLNSGTTSGQIRWMIVLKPFWQTFWQSKVEEFDAIRAGVRVALGDVETIFRAREANRRTKDKAAHACTALCRARVVEELNDARERRLRSI